MHVHAVNILHLCKLFLLQYISTCFHQSRPHCWFVLLQACLLIIYREPTAEHSQQNHHPSLQKRKQETERSMHHENFHKVDFVTSRHVQKAILGLWCILSTPYSVSRSSLKFRNGHNFVITLGHHFPCLKTILRLSNHVFFHIWTVVKLVPRSHFRQIPNSKSWRGHSHLSYYHV